MISIRTLFAAGLAGLTIALLAPVAAAAAPTPDPDRPLFETAAIPAGLSLVVERESRQLRAGRDATYTITIDNRGEEPQPVTVRASLPPWMRDVTAEQAEIGNGYVEWSVTVPPDQSTALTLTGTYDVPGSQERASGPVQVALTACALDQERGQQPIVCATDIGELGAPIPVAVWWVAGAVAVAAAGGTGWFLWHRRRRAAVAEPASTAG